MSATNQTKPKMNLSSVKRGNETRVVTIEIDGFEYDFRLTSDGGLRLNADGALVIEADASNAFTIRPRKQGQVTHVEPAEDPSALQPKSLTPDTVKQSDIDALVTFVRDCASGGYLNTPETARALLRALNLPKEG